MNYIVATCALYRMSQTQFNNNGRALFNYIWVFGHIDYTQDQRSKMQAEWDEATMSKVNISYTHDAPFKWVEYIHELGDKLNKSNMEKRTRFLLGFPEAFDVVVVPERLSTANGGNGNYVFPANYPAHHPQNGNPHAHAGQPDIDSMAREFIRPWLTMLAQGKIKRAPTGMAKHADVESSDDDSEESPHAMAVSRDLINSSFICLYCGGRGHAVQVDGDVCLSKKLGVKIPTMELAQTRYPNGLRYPAQRNDRSDESRRKVINKFRKYQSKMAEIASSDEEAHAVLRRFKKKESRKSRAKLVKESSSSSSNSEQETDQKATETPQTAKFAVAFENIHIQ